MKRLALRCEVLLVSRASGVSNQCPNTLPRLVVPIRQRASGSRPSCETDLAELSVQLQPAIRPTAVLNWTRSEGDEAGGTESTALRDFAGDRGRKFARPRRVGRGVIRVVRPDHRGPCADRNGRVRPRRAREHRGGRGGRPTAGFVAPHCHGHIDPGVAQCSSEPGCLRRVDADADAAGSPPFELDKSVFVRSPKSADVRDRLPGRGNVR